MLLAACWDLGQGRRQENYGYAYGVLYVMYRVQCYTAYTYTYSYIQPHVQYRELQISTVLAGLPGTYGSA